MVTYFDRLIRAVDKFDKLAIAVSGGVDSMVLAYLAHRFSRANVTVVHAVSPAVPATATNRVNDYASRHGWQLVSIDAGEMADPSYLANPVNRCFYCKSSLYARIASVTGLPIASGTNVDDLDDYRPGLDAARDYGVVHPFIEAGLCKRDIYALAEAHGLIDLAALPAQPCLASRVETGIAVDEASLRFVEMVESRLSACLPGAGTVRCRITPGGVYVECDPLPTGDVGVAVSREIAGLCLQGGRVFGGLRPYRRGSAFLHLKAVLSPGTK